MPLFSHTLNITERWGMTMKGEELDPFEEAVLRALPALRRYARSLLPQPSEAEDLTQDCLERAFQKRQTWQGGQVQSWLMTIMTNLHRNRYRTVAQKTEHVQLDDVPSLQADHSQPDPLMQDRLRQAIDSLAPDYRSVLVLVVIEGYSYAQTAQILNIPTGTVMSRLARARKTLGQRLSSANILTFPKASKGHST